MSQITLFDRNIAEIRETLYEFEQPFVLDGSKYASVFGDYATPLSEAIRATIDWFRQQAAKAA